jgi:hypothetical protein
VKLIAEFERFLDDEINLNKNRIETLVNRVDAIEEFLVGSGWSPRVMRFSPQGSWAHKTIIKPPGDQGFDADLLVFVAPVAGWSAENYILKLKETFAGSGNYKDKIALHTRCVRLEYSGDFDIDVVPCLMNRPGATYGYEVCNRTDNRFEPTDGEAYTAWLAQRNDWVGSEKLREVTRLLKYLRDIKSTFSCKSILLTTLLGERVIEADMNFQAQYFPDIATALKTLIGRLDDHLQARPQLHDICNPILPRENFNRHWDQGKYATFRDMIHKYRAWIDEAFAEPDHAKSVTKWQRVFGDEFGRGGENAYVVEAANAAPPIALAPQYSDAVAAVRQAGRGILQYVRRALPWVQPPPWSVIQNGQIPLEIRATLHDQRDGRSLGSIQSGTILPKNKHILFEAFAGGTGAPIAPIREYQVQWQVVNTDHDAYRARQLRGGFYRSDKPAKKWESTQYRGIHWVEAFLIRKRDQRCIGQSPRFFVVIE